MAQAVLGFNEQFERVCEVAVVVLLGGMLSARYLPARRALVRAAAVPGHPPRRRARSGSSGSRAERRSQRGLICWFGIRGVGSLYYLAYAIQHGVDGRRRRAPHRR